MKRIGVTGSKGKLGRLLLEKPNFVALDCDITNLDSLYDENCRKEGLGLVVNCAALSGIEDCAKDYDKAIKVNVRGLANLHKVFGERVLNISSDQVFSGKSWWLPNENTKTSPINNYGWSKVGAEAVSEVNGGKTIRLSRTVSVKDPDIQMYLRMLDHDHPIQVPSFFHRNYIHRRLAVNGIEYFANHYDDMPKIVHYGGTENYAMDTFMNALAYKLEYDPSLVQSRSTYEVDTKLSPRPKKGGLKVDLAKRLGFPMYSLNDTLNVLYEEYDGN